VIVEAASTRGERPEPRATLASLKAGDTLVIYEPDRVARSMKELLVLLEDALHARNITRHILRQSVRGLHRPNASSIADKMLFMVAAMAAENVTSSVRAPSTGWLRLWLKAAKAGGPRVCDPDTLAVALARRARGESVRAIAVHLRIGRSTGPTEIRSERLMIRC
jgi:DNA invertase Pin-like site-specific DNA recombinase